MLHNSVLFVANDDIHLATNVLSVGEIDVLAVRAQQGEAVLAWLVAHQCEHHRA